VKDKGWWGLNKKNCVQIKLQKPGETIFDNAQYQKKNGGREFGGKVGGKGIGVAKVYSFCTGCQKETQNQPEVGGARTTSKGIDKFSSSLGWGTGRKSL